MSKVTTRVNSNYLAQSCDRHINKFQKKNETAGCSLSLTTYLTFVCGPGLVFIIPDQTSCCRDAQVVRRYGGICSGICSGSDVAALSRLLCQLLSKYVSVENNFCLPQNPVLFWSLCVKGIE